MGAERMRSKGVLMGIVGLAVPGPRRRGGPERRVGAADGGGRAGRREARQRRPRALRGAQDVTEGVRRRFEVVRTDVSRMGVQPRVYSRIHWDKTLHDARIEVHMLRDGVVLLRGLVPDAAAKAHAVELARDTVDVTGVVDELETVVPTPAPTTTPPSRHAAARSRRASRGRTRSRSCRRVRLAQTAAPE